MRRRIEGNSVPTSVTSHKEDGFDTAQTRASARRRAQTNQMGNISDTNDSFLHNTRAQKQQGQSVSISTHSLQQQLQLPYLNLKHNPQQQQHIYHKESSPPLVLDGTGPVTMDQQGPPSITYGEVCQQTTQGDRSISPPTNSTSVRHNTSNTSQEADRTQKLIRGDHDSMLVQENTP